MAGTVVAMDVRMAAALAQGVEDVAAFCRAQGISRQSYYKWKKRFDLEGLDGLHERSRRPNTVPISTPAEVEDAVVRARKELADAGEFNGPFSIADRLAAQGIEPVAIAGTLDDHSRLLVGIGAGTGDGTSELVWSVMAAAIGSYGVPSSSLTDNGLCYTTARRKQMRPTAFESNLAALGCRSIASSPYHPQTCGKIERLWQTLKKWLRAREATRGQYRTVSALNRELAVFAEHYNTCRPHRAHHGKTPAAVFAATIAARPADRPLPSEAQLYRCQVSTGGSIAVSGPPGSVRNQLRVHLGGRYKQLPVTVIQDGLRVAVFSGNELIRALDLDPSKIHQPLHP